MVDHASDPVLESVAELVFADQLVDVHELETIEADAWFRTYLSQRQLDSAAFTSRLMTAHEDPAVDEHALERANASRFGLAASVWGADLGRAQALARRIEAGTVWINMHGALHPEVETGGFKESGIGRLHGIDAMNEFLQSKHTAWTTRQKAR